MTTGGCAEKTGFSPNFIIFGYLHSVPSSSEVPFALLNQSYASYEQKITGHDANASCDSVLMFEKNLMSPSTINVVSFYEATRRQTRSDRYRDSESKVVGQAS